MKSDKLQDAIGLVEEELLSRAAKKPKHAVRWTVPVAACLALVLVAVTALGGSFGKSSGSFVVAKAVYPTMVQYWSTSSETYEEEMDRWSTWEESIKKQEAYYGIGKDLVDFYSRSAEAFLGNATVDNRIYSPVNMYLAMAMIAETAAGETQSQIMELLAAESIEDLRTQAHGVWNANYRNDGLVTSILSSSLWMNHRLSFRQQTVDTLARYYYASSYQGRMGSEDFDAAIRNWVNQQTGNQLTEQVNNIKTSPRTGMVLFTTMNFASDWTQSFEPEDTNTQTFHGALQDVERDFMYMEKDLVYYKGESFSAVSKDLKGNCGVKWLLPTENTAVSALLTDPEALAYMFNDEHHEKARYALVKLTVPKLDVNSNIDATEGLKAMGITHSFNPETADFSNLLEKGGSYISDIEHGVRVKMDETGIVAATYVKSDSVIVGEGPDEIIDFTVDRPFIFVVTSADNSPLFVGIINQL